MTFSHNCPVTLVSAGGASHLEVLRTSARFFFLFCFCFILQVNSNLVGLAWTEFGQSFCPLSALPGLWHVGASRPSAVWRLFSVVGGGRVVARGGSGAGKHV